MAMAWSSTTLGNSTFSFIACLPLQSLPASFSSGPAPSGWEAQSGGGAGVGSCRTFHGSVLQGAHETYVSRSRACDETAYDPVRTSSRPFLSLVSATLVLGV